MRPKKTRIGFPDRNYSNQHIKLKVSTSAPIVYCGVILTQSRRRDEFTISQVNYNIKLLACCTTSSDALCNSFTDCLSIYIYQPFPAGLYRVLPGPLYISSWQVNLPQLSRSFQTSHTRQTNSTKIRPRRGKCILYIAQYPVHWTTQFALHFTPLQTCSFRHQLDFNWKLSSHAAFINARRLFTHVSTTFYSQVPIYTAK